MNIVDFQYIKKIVHERSAILLSEDKQYLVESRLSPLARREGLGTIEELVRQMRRQPFNGLHGKVVDAMTTNETSFFRDHHPFETLRTDILPELIQKRAAQRRLTIWCAACSSGQEPYSIALTLREHFPTLRSWNIQIVSSDISPTMLERTKQGEYSQLEVNRGMPIKLLVKHFKKVGTHWQAKDDLRRLVDVRAINLIEPWPRLPQMDLIFLRNVLIYFDLKTKQQILANMRRLMKPDAYLFLGGAETTLNVDNAFERKRFNRTVCYQKKGRP